MSLEDKIKTYAKQYDLSDFHIRSNQPLALRENGSIVVNQEDIISREDIETFWKGNLNKSQLQEIVNNRDLDFAVVVGDFRYRVNGYYSSNGPCMVLRKIVSDIPQMEKLGLPDAVKEAIKLKNGLILVTGQTISLALTAAETGHLVFGTLHASNVSSTITRILDVFPPAQKTLAQSMLAGSIRLVLSQQLLKKKGGGRIGCFEVMTGTTAIRNLIREGKMAQITSTLQTSAKEGMITMEKYLEGLHEKDLVE
jgi:twitching motility protein PilT